MTARVAIVLALGLAACGWDTPARPKGPRPVSAVAPRDSACLTWTQAPVRVSPEGPEPRHHVTTARLPDGTLLATWQVGKKPARIAARWLAADLTPLGPEHDVSGADTRATHPQVATGPDGAAVVWTDDTTGALRWRRLGPDGTPLGGSTDLVAPGGPRPGLYADLDATPDGAWLAVWYGGPTPKPAWTVARVQGDQVTGTWDVPVSPGATSGGPATLRHAPDGTAWVAWPELHANPTGGGESHLRAAALGPTGLGVAQALHTDDEPLERLALGFPGSGQVAAWTRYPKDGGGWGAWLGASEPAGSAPLRPRRIDAREGRMIDLDAAGTDVVVAWEAPGDRADRDLWIEVTAPDGQPRCPAVVAHPPSPDEQTRANLTLTADATGTSGWVFWQSGPTGQDTAVWGRAFRLAATP